MARNFQKKNTKTKAWYTKKTRDKKMPNIITTRPNGKTVVTL